MKRKVITTGDKSSSIYVEELDEHYHSIHGALRESEHVFIKNGLEYFSGHDKINILEIGLGTGLNALLTALKAIERKIAVTYTGVEAYPLTKEKLDALNYPELAGGSEIFSAVFNAIWNHWVEIEKHFRLLKVNADFLQYHPEEAEYDLIYFDAFAPNVQPELWTTEMFVKMHKALRPGGALVTYCAKGQVRRNMKEAGFEVEKLPGPPGKREMMRAFKR